MRAAFGGQHAKSGRSTGRLCRLSPRCAQYRHAFYRYPPDRHQPAGAALPAGMGRGRAAVFAGLRGGYCRGPLLPAAEPAPWRHDAGVAAGMPRVRRLGGVAVDGGVAERRHRRLRHRLAVSVCRAFLGGAKTGVYGRRDGSYHRPAVRAGGSLLPGRRAARTAAEHRTTLGQRAQ